MGWPACGAVERTPRRKVALPSHTTWHHSAGRVASNHPPLRRAAMSTFHDLEMTSITGEQISFSTYAGKLVLVVNVASY